MRVFATAFFVILPCREASACQRDEIGVTSW
jgi:hypothetical protein